MNIAVVELKSLHAVKLCKNDPNVISVTHPAALNQVQPFLNLSNFDHHASIVFQVPK